MLAIAGGKGGAGKTTTTLGLAAAMDGPTLVVDADVDMPNLHAMAGVERTPTLGVSDGAAAAQTHPEEPSVSVLPAPRDGGVVEGGETAARANCGPNRPFEAGRRAGTDASRALARLDAEAAVLVDCPAGASPDAVAPLRVADGALVVSTACAPALRDAAKTAAMARAVGTPVVGAVLTRTHLRPPVVADLLSCPVLAAVPAATPPLERRVVRAAYGRLAKRLHEEKLLAA